jgi:CheY-like chemotaxis protein
MLKPKSILLIDDDEDDRWLFTEAISRTVPSVRCTSVSSGPEALDFLSLQDRQFPDIIFLDLNMPGMDGKKCLAELKNDPRINNIPVIVYSTSNFHKDINEAKALGAHDFIIKPSDYQQLCTLIKKIFDDGV